MLYFFLFSPTHTKLRTVKARFPWLKYSFAILFNFCCCKLATVYSWPRLPGEKCLTCQSGDCPAVQLFSCLSVGLREGCKTNSGAVSWYTESKATLHPYTNAFFLFLVVVNPICGYITWPIGWITKFRFWSQKQKNLITKTCSKWLLEKLRNCKWK